MAESVTAIMLRSAAVDVDVAARYGLVEAGRLDRQRTLAAIADLLAWASLQVSGAGAA